MKIVSFLLVPTVAAAAFLASGDPVHADSDGVSPVLMVISNQDFWYQDYADTRSSLEAAGLEVVVAATTAESSPTRPEVTPDLALADVDAEAYSGIVFAGGWGMAQYQYGFKGTYHNSAYSDPRSAAIVNDLINAFVDRNRPIAAICNGVSVLAWARVGGESLLEGKTVTGWNGTLPGFELDGQSYAAGTVPARWQIEAHGAAMSLSAAIGDPQTSADDVIVDGNIITAENYDSAYAFGREIARSLATR